MMMKDEEPILGPTVAPAPAAAVVPAPPTEYVYEFIKNIESHNTQNYNVHITDIRVDGVRVSPGQIVLHEEPNHAKCNSKAGGYQCEGDNYGLNDPEPANPIRGFDLVSVEGRANSSWFKGYDHHNSNKG
jgi:hypothetical protein